MRVHGMGSAGKFIQPRDAEAVLLARGFAYSLPGSLAIWALVVTAAVRVAGI